MDQYGINTDSVWIGYRKERDRIYQIRWANYYPRFSASICNKEADLLIYILLILNITPHCYNIEQESFCINIWKPIMNKRDWDKIPSSYIQAEFEMIKKAVKNI